jgi:hypothetical protein
MAKRFEAFLFRAPVGTWARGFSYLLFTPFGIALAKHSSLMPWLAGLSVGFELLFGLYYLFPYLRLPLLLTAITFHLGTLVFLGIDFFHLWIFSLSAALLAPEAIYFDF